MPELRDLAVEWVSLVDKAAVRDPSNPTEPQRLLLWKAERGANNNPDKGGSMSEDTDLRAALDKAEAERDEALDKLAKAEKKLAKKDKGESAEEINKNDLPPAVRERLEKLEKAEKDANERLAKAEEIAKAERDERITREFVAKAELDFGHVGGDATEFGKLLKSASENLSKEEYEALETRLRAAEEQVAKSELFKSFGRDGDPAPTAASAATSDRLAKAVEEIKKADPNLSDYDAQERAMRDNPDLAREYLANAR